MIIPESIIKLFLGKNDFFLLKIIEIQIIRIKEKISKIIIELKALIDIMKISHIL